MAASSKPGAAALAGGALQLYLRFVATHFRAQMQYPGAFGLQVLGSVMFTGIEFVGVWALLDRFGNVRGWELAEVAVLYGMVMVGFATAEATGRGVRHVPSAGARRRLRPRAAAPAAHGVAGGGAPSSPFTAPAAGCRAPPFSTWGLVGSGIAWSPARVLLLAETIAGVTVLFLGVFVATAAVTFWTVQSLELLAIVSNGSVDAASYPATVYRRFMRRFLFFIVPIGTVTYFPVAALLGRPDPLGTPPWFGWVAPAAAPLFLAAALFLWRLGVRHYNSTGS